MKKKVFISLSFPPEVISNFDSCVQHLKDNGFEVTIDPRYRTLSQAELVEQLDGVYAFVASAETVDDALLEHTPELKIVSRMGVGYDKVDVDALNRRGVALTITPGANADAVAEFAVSLMMAATRKVKQIDAFTHQGVWKTHFGCSVSGKTLGIIGLGNIGKKVVKYLSGFDMRVISYDMFPNAEYAAAHNITMLPLDDVIQQSDYLFIHAPYTKETYHLMNAERFAMMKKGSFFINCARGEIVDETALYEALKSGHLAGAGLDVFEQEPIDMSNPLLTLENVVISSHTAGMTFEGRKKVIDIAFQNIIDLSNGEKPKGLINPQALEKNETI